MTIRRLIDLDSVIKTIQIISSEINFESLLHKIIKSITEITKAEKALLILKENNQWLIQAHNNSSQIKVLQGLKLNSEGIPIEIINQVINNSSPVLISNTLNQTLFKFDLQKIKSLICYPIFNNKKEILGIFYLENVSVREFFNTKNSNLLEYISTQIGISLDNSLKFENMEKQIIQLEKMSTLGNILSGVSHEINNPINFVSGISINLDNNFKDLKKFIFELAGDDADQSFFEIFETYFRKIQSNLSDMFEGSNRIKTIVNDLRTYSRIDEIEQDNTDITEGIISSVRLVSSEYRKNVEFIFDLNEKTHVKCFPSQLNQVFVNIIINGCQAIKEKQTKNNNEDKGKLKIKTFVENNYFVIEFTDNGVGMTEETKNKVFEPFFTTKDKDNGTGLGMSVSNEIIKKHHGYIKVESQFNIGTTFTVYLPC